MKYLYCVFFLFASINCLAATNVTQSDLPMELTIEGETYVVQEDLVQPSGDAFSAKASFVKLNLNGHELTYATTGQGEGFVIGNSTIEGVEIYGGTITQGGSFASSSCFDNDDLGIPGLKIHDMTLNVEQYIASAIEVVSMTKDSPNIEIYNCIINVNNDFASIEGRGTHSGIEISASSNVSGRIHHNTITMGDKVYKARCSNVAIIGAGTDQIEVDNNILYMYHELEGEGFRSYRANNDWYHHNTVYQECEDCRAYLVDGGTDGNIYEYGTIYQNLKGGFGTIYRVRYDSDNVTIRYNTSHTGGAYEEFGVSVGSYCDSFIDCGGIGGPNNTKIYGNSFSVTSAGINVRPAAVDTNVYCNDITAGASGYPVVVTPNDELTAQISNLYFSENTFSGGLNTVKFTTTYGNMVNPAIFCASSPALSASDFTGGIEGTDYTITTSGCVDACTTPTRPVVTLQADKEATSPTTYTGSFTVSAGRTAATVVSSNGFTVTCDDGDCTDEETEAFTVSGVTVPITDVITVTDSSAETGNDSITITAPTPTTSGIIKGAIIKGAIIK